MAITLVASQANNSNTLLAMPAHQAGDLLIGVAFRDGNTTAPTRPAGWSDPAGAATRGSNTCSMRVAWKIAASSSETNPTWTNANGVAVAVYRPSSSETWQGTPIDAAFGGGASNTITYPNSGAAASKYWVRVAGHRNPLNLTSNTPSGWNARAGHPSEVRIIDSGWKSTAVDDNAVGGNTQSVSNSSGYQAASISLLFTETGAPWDNYEDDFNAGSLDPWWTDLASTYGGTTTVGGGVVSFASTSGIQSAISYDFRGTDLFIEVVSTGSMFQVLVGGANGVVLSGGTLYTYLDSSPVVQGTSYGWYRIAESSGTVVIYGSNDGSSWTSLRSGSTPSGYSNGNVVVAGNSSQFDNFNTLGSVAHTADASITVTANRTAAVQHGKTAQASFPITSTRTAAVARSAAAEATLSLLATLLAGTTASSVVGSALQITVDRTGETTMTTQSGTTIVSSASLQSSITITRYGEVERPITASTSGSISLDAAGEADRVINVTLEATAATGILAKQLDVSAILLAAAQVAGVTGGNMWTTTILESTAAVYSNIASLDLDVLADVLVQAVNVAPGSVDADATEASLTAAATALRNVNAASPLVAALIAETVQLFGAVAQESVTAVLPASVQGALLLTGLRSALVGLDASAFTEFRPIAPGIRTVHIGRDDRVMRIPADDRVLKVRPDRPMRVHLG